MASLSRSRQAVKEGHDRRSSVFEGERPNSGRDHNATHPTPEPNERTNGLRPAFTRAEAARALGMSINSFERHLQPELRLVRRGKLRIIPVAELQRWLEENAEWTLPAS